MLEKSTKPKIDVVAGIIVNADGEVLIAKRPAHLDQGGLWEFPGGKREAHESDEQALVRELYEELDITAERATRMLGFIHEYPNKTVNLRFFEVTKWRGKARGKEDQSILWVTNKDLERFTFPAANEVVLRARKFRRITIQVSVPLSNAGLSQQLFRYVQTGLANVHLTALEYSATEQRQCEQLYNLCEKYDVQLLLDIPQQALADFPNAVWHLPRHRLCEFSQRPISSERLLSCGCRDIDDLNKARQLGADLLFLSLGHEVTEKHVDLLTGYREFISQSSSPIFTVGNLDQDSFLCALGSGCYGMAVNIDAWNLAAYPHFEERLRATVDAAMINLEGV